jgi:hypothetical protein
VYAFEQSPFFAQLVRGAPLNELGPGQRQQKNCDALCAAPVAELFAPHQRRDQQAARACVAGLLLLYDGLDESHAISQDLADSTGSYWHGIMHRREPDYSNAKYWFARVGSHPVYPAVAKAASALVQEAKTAQVWPAAQRLLNQESWQADTFVDLCRTAKSAGPAADRLCRQIQRKETELLLEFCYRLALGD